MEIRIGGSSRQVCERYQNARIHLVEPNLAIWKIKINIHFRIGIRFVVILRQITSSCDLTNFFDNLRRHDFDKIFSLPDIQSGYCCDLTEKIDRFEGTFIWQDLQKYSTLLAKPGMLWFDGFFYTFSETKLVFKATNHKAILLNLYSRQWCYTWEWRARTGRL